MKRNSIATLFCFAVTLTTASAGAQTNPEFQAVAALMDSARAIEAPVFAPEAWKNAEKQFDEAQRAVNQGKKAKDVLENTARARQQTENAIKACEVAKLTLAEYLTVRNNARKAHAQARVPQLYAECELQFMKATAKVEKGDVKGGLKEAARAVPLFSNAELQAIRVELLNSAQAQIAKAKTDEAEKYAPATLDRAGKALAKADSVLHSNRYERTRSLKFVADAEYEAQHASHIAQHVRALERNDQAWEKLMLIYEQQMDRVGTAAGLSHLPFDKGPLAATDTLIRYVQHGQSLRESTDSLQGQLRSQLRQSLSRMGVEADRTSLADLSRLLDEKLAMLVLERDDLQTQVQSSAARLAQVEWEQASVSEELAQRLKREERFSTAQKLIRPSEGEVLWNSSNDLVLRMTGLKFEVGSADVTDEMMPLLDKVVEIVQMDNSSRIVVEGHTDASGDPATNQQLSEKRAYAVMMYLRRATGMSADRIRSLGYGSDKPIGSNDTPEGRAKNRRNDIVIMQ
jgi:outer membrane protein OmpA-like peptidoglycan-associated protein